MSIPACRRGGGVFSCGGRINYTKQRERERERASGARKQKVIRAKVDDAPRAVPSNEVERRGVDTEDDLAH